MYHERTLLNVLNPLKLNKFSNVEQNLFNQTRFKGDKNNEKGKVNYNTSLINCLKIPSDHRSSLQVLVNK